ncbi:DOPA-like domain-containing protein [Mycena epipterygia]|nr:DOPA-like domain-containing protein [Mycena epipterygia]
MNPDGSLINTPGPRSAAYTAFLAPILPTNNGFDFHVYYTPGAQTDHARTLHARIRKEFPELRIYRFWDRPVGPHPTAMFEVNVFDPHQTGALFSWLAVNRGPCSVLIHPNTADELADHTVLASWMGTPLELRTKMFLERKGVGATTPAAPAASEVVVGE